VYDDLVRALRTTFTVGYRPRALSSPYEAIKGEITEHERIKQRWVSCQLCRCSVTTKHSESHEKYNRRPVCFSFHGIFSEPTFFSTMRPQILSFILFLANVGQATVAFPRSTVNGECTGAGGAPGVCIATGSCTGGGGSYISNACPGTPNNIKCCVKNSCGSGGRNGDCRWTSQCGAGKTTLSGLCPGPTDFKCCVDDSTTTPPPPPSGDSNIGEKILAKAKTAEGTPCRLISNHSIFPY